MCCLTHGCVYLEEILPMLGLNHRSVNLRMDKYRYGMGHMIIYVILDYTPWYDRCITYVRIIFLKTYTTLCMKDTPSCIVRENRKESFKDW